MNMLPKSHQSLQTLKFPFIANQEINVPVNGTYFKYESGSGEISVKTTEGLNIKRDVGGAIKCSEFSELRIQDLSGADDTKVFTIGYGEIKDNSVSGTIDVDTIGSIIDPVLIGANQDLDSINGKVFRGGKSVTGAGGNYVHIGVRNPALSGINIFIDNINSIMTDGGSYGSSQLTMTIINDSSLLTPQDSLNHKINESTGAGKIVSGIHTSIYGTEYDYFIAPTGSQFNLNLKNSILIPPDYTLFLVCKMTTIYMNASFEWREKAI